MGLSPCANGSLCYVAPVMFGWSDHGVLDAVEFIIENLTRDCSRLSPHQSPGIHINAKSFADLSIH